MHGYLKVDLAIVERVLRESLSDLEAFAAHVEQVVGRIEPGRGRDMRRDIESILYAELKPSLDRPAQFSACLQLKPRFVLSKPPDGQAPPATRRGGDG